jgi:hypothetical protein
MRSGDQGRRSAAGACGKIREALCCPPFRTKLDKTANQGLVTKCQQQRKYPSKKWATKTVGKTEFLNR